MSPLTATLMLAASTLALFLACLSPALLEWWRRTDAPPLVVVRSQDTNIRHFAVSFAEQVQQRLAGELDRAAESPTPIEGVWHGTDRYVLLPDASVDWLHDDERRQRRVGRLLLAGTALTLPGGIVFEKEVYARSDLEAGDDLALRGCFVRGRTVLGDRVVVARWLHGEGAVVCGRDARLYGRLSSDTRLQLGAGTRFERVSAPVIRFATSTVEFRPASRRETGRERWEPGEVEYLDPRTVLLRGDWKLPPHSHITFNVVCRGSLRIGAGSLVEGAVKAWHRLQVDSGTIVRGALVCGGAMQIDHSVVAAGPLVAEGILGIGEGCIIGGPQMQTTVTAPVIRVAPGSQVSGSVWAGSTGEVGRDDQDKRRVL